MANKKQKKIEQKTKDVQKRQSSRISSKRQANNNDTIDDDNDIGLKRRACDVITKPTNKRKKLNDDVQPTHQKKDDQIQNKKTNKKTNNKNKDHNKDDKKLDDKKNDDKKNDDKKNDDKKDEDKIQKVITKGGCAVDPHCRVKDSVHVYVKNGVAYDCTLNQSNIGGNNNKFYKLQVLQHDNNSNQFYTFFRWGRVGANGQLDLDGPTSEASAINKFESKKRSKKSGGYTEIKIVMDQEEDEDEADNEKKENEDYEKSKLDRGVKDLIRLIFDMKMMNNQMKEIGYDAQKLPLGKLSPEVIQKGYSILKEISDMVNNDKNINLNRPALQNLCSQFYSYIPHNFGFQKMHNFVIDTKQKVKEKLDLLGSLENIQIATKLLKGDDKNKDGNMIDLNYNKLECDIKSMDRSEKMYEIIQDYITKTHGSTHSGYNLELMQVYSLDKEVDRNRFQNQMHNKMLLWHGSRLTNYVGILSQGLRIAPPEAPVQGYMFGKGVYFADMVSKSANYCFTNKQNNIGLLLLCEVGLGNTNDLVRCCYTANNLPQGKHSTKGVGRVQPDSKDHKVVDGVTIPIGKETQQTQYQNTSLIYNEFIVYDLSQIKLKYLLKVKFNHKW